jgi:hypothetical protein
MAIETFFVKRCSHFMLSCLDIIFPIKVQLDLSLKQASMPTPAPTGREMHPNTNHGYTVRPLHDTRPCRSQDPVHVELFPGCAPHSSTAPVAQSGGLPAAIVGESARCRPGDALPPPGPVQHRWRAVGVGKLGGNRGLQPTNDPRPEGLTVLTLVIYRMGLTSVWPHRVVSPGLGVR